jgi:glycosyltransferase involved in cell wall biosynthesis
MVASLSSRTKKHALFVDAAARVGARSKRDVEFRMYGHRDESDAYARSIAARANAAGLGERFRFMGFVPDPPSIMREIDLLVHPADNESFGRIVVEAWAARVAVVGVAAGGVAAIVRDGVDGLLARPDDADGLAALIARAIDDDALRSTLADNGFSAARERFSLSAYAQRMADAYARAFSAAKLRTARRGTAAAEVSRA